MVRAIGQPVSRSSQVNSKEKHLMGELLSITEGQQSSWSRGTGQNSLTTAARELIVHEHPSSNGQPNATVE